MSTTSPTFLLSVTESVHASRDMVLLSLADERGDFAKTHAKPGQYVMARLPHFEKAKPFVLASRPGASRVELLIKAKDTAELEKLLALGGAQVEMGAASGAGYPLERAKGRPVLLFAVGSAVAALRPVIEELLENPESYGPVHFWYGARTDADFAYTSDSQRWSDGLSTFVRTTSQSPSASWQGQQGRVQAHIPARLEGAEEAVAFVCGLPAMEKEVMQLLQERGVAADSIHRNF